MKLESCWRSKIEESRFLQKTMKIAHRRDQQEIHSPPLLSPFPLIPNCIAQKRRQKLRKRHEENQDLTEANSENKSDEMAAEETSLTFFKNTGRDGVMQNVSAESVKHLLTWLSAMFTSVSPLSRSDRVHLNRWNTPKSFCVSWNFRLTFLLQIRQLSLSFWHFSSEVCFCFFS